MESKHRIAYKVLQKLQSFSNSYINLIIDYNLEIPGLSYLDELGLSIIRLNLTKIPECENTIAHVLSHEYGHHMMGHVKVNPQFLFIYELNKCEDEADRYAKSFIRANKYDLKPIEQFVRTNTQCNKLLKNRLDILLGK